MSGSGRAATTRWRRALAAGVVAVAVPLGVFAAAAPAAHAQDLTEDMLALSGLAQTTGSGHSLTDKLQQVGSYLQAGDVADACGTLGAFTNEVNAQTGKTIPADTAAEMLPIVGDLQLLLGC